METNPTGTELNIKLERIRGLLVKFDLDALLLRQTGNFAWATCGADSHINTADSMGIASLLIVRHFALFTGRSSPFDASSLVYACG